MFVAIMAVLSVVCTGGALVGLWLLDRLVGWFDSKGRR
jgi:hypothetical protein